MNVNGTINFLSCSEVLLEYTVLHGTHKNERCSTWFNSEDEMINKILSDERMKAVVLEVRK